QGVRRPRQFGPEVGQAHQPAIAVLHRTTLLLHESVYLQRKTNRRANRCGSSAVVGPSWRRLLRRRGGGEDPWLCAPGFRRVCPCRQGGASWETEIPRRHGGVKDRAQCRIGFVVGSALPISVAALEHSGWPNPLALTPFRSKS